MSTDKRTKIKMKNYKGKGGKSNQVDEENVTLRIHRGKRNQRSDLSLSNSAANLDGLRNHASVTSMPSFERRKRRSSRLKEKVTISISYPSTEHITSPTMSTTSSNQASMISSSCSKEPIALRHSNSADCHNIFKESSTRTDNSPNNSHKKAGKRTSSGMKVQVRKFRMETKAAKTLAIIVGKCHVVTRRAFTHTHSPITSWSDFCPSHYEVRSHARARQGNPFPIFFCPLCRLKPDRNRI